MGSLVANNATLSALNLVIKRSTRNINRGIVPKPTNLLTSPSSSIWDYTPRSIRFTEEAARLSLEGRPQHAIVGKDNVRVLETNPFGIRTVSCIDKTKKNQFLNLSETISWGISSPNNRIALLDEGTKTAVYVADLESILIINDVNKGGSCDFFSLDWPSAKNSFKKRQKKDDVRMYDGKERLIVARESEGMRLYDWKKREVIHVDAPNTRFSPLPIPTPSTRLSLTSSENTSVSDPNENHPKVARFLAHKGHLSYILDIHENLEYTVEEISSDSDSLETRDYNEYGLAPPLTDSHYDLISLDSKSMSLDSWKSQKKTPSENEANEETIVWTGNQQKGLVLCKSNNTIELSDPNRLVRRVIQTSFNDENDDHHLKWIWAGFSADSNDPYLYTLQQNLPNEVNQNDNGLLRAWQIDSKTLKTSLETWLRHTGLSSPREHVESNKNAPEMKQPKHGEEDDLEHFGGNTYAGGTGGSDTAGLGGRGGPYRLDKGKFNVRQLKNLPIKSKMSEAAREMNRKVYNERMNAIGMSSQASDAYLDMSERVSTHVSYLIDVLDTVSKKKKETKWLKRQSYGELDETRLVDMVVGERDVFKRRAKETSIEKHWWEKANPGSSSEEDGDSGDFLHVRVAFDVSGSMYRFQSLDQRLSRELETALMLMKAFHEKNDFLKYTFVGHSGEESSADLNVSDWNKPPKTEMEFFKVLEIMKTHSQFCQSGDNTIEAMYSCVEACLQVTQSHSAAQVDNHYVPLAIVVSDANLRRYGIAPKELRDAMESAASNQVKTHVVFIASLADEAEVLKRELPNGRAHVATRPDDVPRILRDIITSSVQT